MIRLLLVELALFFMMCVLWNTSSISEVPGFENCEEGTVIVMGNNVNVRKEPAIGSDVLFQLNFGTYVKILTKNTTQVTINGNSGNWVFIDTCTMVGFSEETIKGWMFDYYLGYYNKFEPVTDWNIKELNETAIDTVYKYKFQNSGEFALFESEYVKFKEKEKCKNNGGMFDTKESTCNYSGKIYLFRNLYWLKVNEKQDGGKEYLVKCKDGKLRFFHHLSYWGQSETEKSKCLD
jgi:hypothetical protein